MMGKTHKAVGCLAMLCAYQILESKGYLIQGVHPLVQLAVMYPACSWGSTAPDLDQSSVDIIPEKTPVSILIYKILHIGKIRHRSWQTHSPWMFILINAILWCSWFFLFIYPTDGYTMNAIIMRLILTGFSVGYASHLIADSITYEGIPLGGKKWLRLVPHKDIFKTNTTYETVVRRLTYVAIFGLLVYKIIRKG